jgi:hypothetical protein
MLASVESELCIDLDAVFVTGGSNGGVSQMFYVHSHPYPFTDYPSFDCKSTDYPSTDYPSSLTASPPIGPPHSR